MRRSGQGWKVFDVMVEGVSYVQTFRSLPALAGELSPEQQLTLTSLRAGERARLAKAVGALEAMPLYRADLSVDPAARTVAGGTSNPQRTVREVVPTGPGGRWATIWRGGEGGASLISDGSFLRDVQIRRR